jgi:protein tyrosine phosphatase (PTP) superfamily phosphohydrolase (DUF442 family)
VQKTMNRKNIGLIMATLINCCSIENTASHSNYKNYNFHTVETRKLYRAAQMDSETLDKCMKQFGIKTVVNLRGKSPAQWCKTEKSIVEQNGGQYHCITMCTATLTSSKNLKKLLSIYESAPRPILIHCIRGASRTGEAAALWKLDQEKKGKDEALKQLDKKYGHDSKSFPAKTFLIKIWQGLDWALSEYDHLAYPQHCR